MKWELYNKIKCVIRISKMRRATKATPPHYSFHHSHLMNTTCNKIYARTWQPSLNFIKKPLIGYNNARRNALKEKIKEHIKRTLQVSNRPISGRCC